MTPDQEDALKTIERLQLYRPDQMPAVSAERMGGTTNRVFMIKGPSGSHVLRIPGKGTEVYINRRAEAVAARAAARAGVSPKVLMFEADGVMLIEAIEDARTMTPMAFGADPGAVGRAGEALRQLHDSGETFDFRFELFSMIDDYLKVLAAKNATVPDGYHDVLASARTVQAALQAHPLPLSPCHCDPLSENFLDTGKKMWIIDWEYSGMNDPLWDVGDLAVEAELSPDNEKVLIERYFGRLPTPSESGRIIIYKAMCDLLWTLWGLIQFADDNPAEDFWAYAKRRFGRCRALMNTAEFSAGVAAVAGRVS